MARRQADDGGLRQQLERLYALPPASFTAARQELAARLREEGRRHDAAAVKALRRPTPASWAVNRLLRLEPRRFEDLLAAGRQARHAQRRALAGKGATAEAAGELRESLHAAKRLVEELRQRGLEMLAGGGMPPTAATVDRLTADLQALAYTAEAERELAQGWLDHDLEAPGFEVLAGLQAAAGAGPATAGARRPPRGPAEGRSATKEANEGSAARSQAGRAPSSRGGSRQRQDDRHEHEQGSARDQARELRERRLRERQRERAAAAAAAVEGAKDEAVKRRAAAAAAEREASAAERAVAEAGRRAEQARREAQRERQRAEHAEELLRRARERQAAARGTPG